MKRLAISAVAFAVALCAVLPAALGIAAGNRPIHVTSGNLEADLNAGFAPTKFPRTKPARASFTFSARFRTADGGPVPTLKWVNIETDRNLNLNLEKTPSCSLAQLRGTDSKSASAACPRALIGAGTASTEPHRRATAKEPIQNGPEPLVFNGGTVHGVTTLLVHVSFPESTPKSIVFPVNVREIEKGRFGLRWSAKIPAPPAAATFTRFDLRLQKGVTATCSDGKLVVRGAAGFADADELSFRVARQCTTAPAAPTARRELANPLPTVQATFSARPTPVPPPSQGRVPVSLRLSDEISTTDGTHPPAVKSILMDLDGQYGLDLSKVKRCPPELQYDNRQVGDPCEGVKFGVGKLTVEVAFPETQPISVAGRAIAFKQIPGKITIRAFLSAPVTGTIAIPFAVGKNAPGRYGIKLTGTVPKIAGGSGSITDLNMRFRKGVFSAACPSGRLQSAVTNAFADGDSSAVATTLTC